MITALADENLAADRAAFARALVSSLASAGAAPTLVSETSSGDGWASFHIVFPNGFTAHGTAVPSLNLCGLTWSTREGGPIAAHAHRGLA